MFPVDPPVVEQGIFHAIPSQAIIGRKEVKHLMSLLYDHPERDFFVYFRDGQGIGRALTEAEQNGYVLLEKITRDFYAHPKFNNDWVRISKNRTLYEWERQVVEQGPMYKEATLALSEIGKRKIERERNRLMTWLTLSAIWAALIALVLAILGLQAALKAL